MATSSTGWTVTAQHEDTQVLANGKVAHGVVVTFATAGGHTGTVFIPDADYTPDKARGLIAARAALMDTIGKLAGG